ncbi:MAG TPA: serine hydrolase domain-containing protein [Pseudonocardiaceae bacterium]|nr:serine hydrolase domain-containing protein [Pseudonocardiaceae bacterium]
MAEIDGASAGRTEISGTVEDGFEGVREAFAASLARRDEVGAAVCVYFDGRPVVDLWGGIADRESGRPWRADTLEIVYSATKAVTATCALLLVERGELDLDAPVSEYWPEFAAEGKGGVPVRWLLSHRVGLPVLDNKASVADALAWEPMVEALAAQRPSWEPGTAHGYHAQSYGFLVGEVIRRVSGRRPGRFFAEEVAGGHGIEFWIGLPPELHDRVGTLIEVAPPRPATVDPDVLAQLPDGLRALFVAFTDPNSLTSRAFALTDQPLDFNSPEVHAAELPASNGICTARGLARFYAGLIGEVDGARILTEDTLRAALVEQSYGDDRILKQPSRFGLGFMLPVEQAVVLGGPTSFGHPGRGGALGFADPARGISFGYVPNRMRSGVAGDLRSARLVKAVAAALAEVG